MNANSNTVRVAHNKIVTCSDWLVDVNLSNDF